MIVQDKWYKCVEIDVEYLDRFMSKTMQDAAVVTVGDHRKSYYDDLSLGAIFNDMEHTHTQLYSPKHGRYKV